MNVATKKLFQGGPEDESALVSKCNINIDFSLVKYGSNHCHGSSWPSSYSSDGQILITAESGAV